MPIVKMSGDWKGNFIIAIIILLLILTNVKKRRDAFVNVEGYMKYVPEITDEEVQAVTNGNLIFFHETSQRLLPQRVLQISARQACAVESAARTNPNSTIFLLYTVSSSSLEGPVYLSKSIHSHSALLHYRNIRIRKLDLQRYLKNTPLEEWYSDSSLSKSLYPIEHTSDVLRYMTLWKYGGTYLDLDFVVMRNLEDIGTNYVVAESENEMSNGVLNFERQGIGHNFSSECIDEIKTHYRADAWSYNGPELILRVLNKICGTNQISDMIKNEGICKGINVFKPQLFYPVPYPAWKLFFNPEKVTAVLKMAETSYGIHVWNKLSGGTVIDTGIQVAYSVVAKQYCPNSYKESGNTF